MLNQIASGNELTNGMQLHLYAVELRKLKQRKTTEKKFTVLLVLERLAGVALETKGNL